MAHMARQVVCPECGMSTWHIDHCDNPVCLPGRGEVQSRWDAMVKMKPHRTPLTTDFDPLDVGTGDDENTDKDIDRQRWYRRLRG